MKKHYILALALLSSLALTSCSEKESNEQSTQQAPPLLEVGVVITKKEDLPITTSQRGRLEPFRQAEVRARVSGIILERCYEEGQKVEEGTVLFKIDPAPYIATRNIAKATLQRAKANLVNAEDQVQRYAKLIDSHAISERTHTEAVIQEMVAKAEVESAKAQLEQAELELGYATVTSPIAGIARRAMVTEGALVGHGTATPLTTVDQIDPIYVKFSQPYTDINERRKAIATGKWEEIKQEDIKVYLDLGNDNVYPETGSFFFVDTAVDEGTDAIEMRAQFPNEKMVLLPGAFVRVRFVSAIQKNIIKVPRDAVLRSEHGTIVLTVAEDGTITPKPVTTDKIDGKNWIITDGLDSNEKVVTEQVSLVGMMLQNMPPNTPLKVKAGRVLDLEGNILEGSKKEEEPSSPPAENKGDQKNSPQE